MCRQIHLPHATFSQAQSLHSTDDTCARLTELNKLKSELCAKTSLIRASCFILRLTVPLNTSTSSLSPTSLVLHPSTSPTQACCPRVHLPTAKIHGRMALLRQPLTGYEPKGIELDRTMFNLSNQEIDDQDDIEEIGVKPLSYSQSLIHSAYDSAESIATPPDWDLEDEQLRKMLASPLYTEVSGYLMQKVHRSEKQMTTSTSLPLKARKHDVKFFSRSGSSREI